MNLYFFAPWIILAFMIAVVLTTLMVVHFLITICLVDYQSTEPPLAELPHRQQLTGSPTTVTDGQAAIGHPTGHQQYQINLVQSQAELNNQLNPKSQSRAKKHSKKGGKVYPWIGWGYRGRRRSDKQEDQAKSYYRSSSYCDLAVTSASYQPYPSSWLLNGPEMYQRSAYHHDDLLVNSTDNQLPHLLTDRSLQPAAHHSSYDSLTTTATTDTEYYRDWNHSIEFTDFSEFYVNTIDPKYKDSNQNVIYI